MASEADTVLGLRNLLQHSSSLSDHETVVRAVNIITTTERDGKAMEATDYDMRRDALDFAIRRCEDNDTADGIVARAEAYHKFLSSALVTAE